MSFISKTQGVAYEPGHFLAHAECTRETREFSQENALTGENGGKYVPMGTAYPSNDANAIGITYEDVDVTYGNMPGSVVTRGEIYEDRLAITGQTYSAVTPEGAENPAVEGWYEKDGNEYVKTTDETVDSEKTYYEVSGVVRLSSAAKTALEARGFVFRTVPVVTRPDFN